MFNWQRTTRSIEKTNVALDTNSGRLGLAEVSS